MWVRLPPRAPSNRQCLCGYWSGHFLTFLMIAITFEAIWTLPLVGLILLTRRNLVKHPVWGALIGAGIGGLYAVALSFLVGPSIQTADVPFLPLAMTMGTGFGAFAG